MFPPMAQYWKVYHLVYLASVTETSLEVSQIWSHCDVMPAMYPYYWVLSSYQELMLFIKAANVWKFIRPSSPCGPRVSNQCTFIYICHDPFSSLNKMERI